MSELKVGDRVFKHAVDGSGRVTEGVVTATGQTVKVFAGKTKKGKDRFVYWKDCVHIDMKEVKPDKP